MNDSCDNRVHIYDQILTPTEVEIAASIISSKNWEYSGRSGMKSDKPSFWYMNLTDEDFFTKIIFEKVTQVVGGDFELQRVYANGHTFALDGEFHVDDEREEAYTCILYLSPEITNESVNDIGGYTLFKTNENYVTGVLPIFNRAVIFKSNVLHCGLSPSRFSGVLRITVAFKLLKVSALK
jgi:hypothetical protein